MNLNDKIDVDFLKKLKIDEQIFLVDCNFKNYLRKVISSCIAGYKQIPLQWEDFYYSFLIKINEIINKIDRITPAKFRVFLGLEMRYFTKNMIRKYNTKKYKILNEATSFNEILNNEMVVNHHGNYIEEKIDFSCLNDFELKIYDDFFVHDLSLKKIMEKEKISMTKLKATLDSIKIKVKSNLEKDFKNK